MSLHELVQVGENRFGHGVDCVGTQTLARDEKVHHRRGLDRLELSLYVRVGMTEGR